jgi:hypothetical protein
MTHPHIYIFGMLRLLVQKLLVHCTCSTSRSSNSASIRFPCVHVHACLISLHVTLQANGADIKGGTWFETGAEMLNGGTLNYFAVPFGIVNNPLPLVAITLVEVVLIGAVENYR